MSNVSKFAALIRRHIGNPEIIFEFGARDCAETVMISDAFPNARIYTFECNQATLPICRHRTEGNPRIMLVECAVGETDGMATFHPIDQQKTVTTWPDGNPGASSLFLASGKYDVESYVQRTEEVSMIRPDTFMSHREIPKIDAVWMDIQGAELMALRGFGERITDVGLLSLEAEFVEIYDRQPLFWEIHDFLFSKGFLLTSFLTLGRFSCDAVFVQCKKSGFIVKFHSWQLHFFARLMIGVYFPIRRKVGLCLRKIGLIE